ncbi:MAG: SDR family oxidoreductase [Aestuariibacter sp.]
MNNTNANALPICLITGVGPGTGTALVERFLKGGYRVAMMARSSEKLEQISKKHANAYAFPCDVSEPSKLEQAVKAVQSELGSISVVIHNAIGGTFGNFMEVDIGVLEAPTGLLIFSPKTA